MGCVDGVRIRHLLSLCANIGSAPRLTVFSIVVAACPPLALLLAVELLKRHRGSSQQPDEGLQERGERELVDRPQPAACSVDPHPELTVPCESSAEALMWAYYVEEQAAGRTPTGADLDRVAGTNNYGRRVLRRWRASGHGPDGRPASRPTAGQRRSVLTEETVEKERAEVLQPAG